MPDALGGRRDLIVPLVSSILFVTVPLALMAAGTPLNGIGWLSIGFGLIGIIAIGAQMAGFQPRQRPSKSKTVRGVAKSQPVYHKGPLPELSAHKQAQIRRVVRVMAEAGVFAPQPPDAAHLYAGAAEMGWSILPDTVLLALLEADYYHPGFNPDAHMGNLVLHEVQVETSAARIGEMIRDLERLSTGALGVADLIVTQDVIDPSARTVRTSVTMTINGEPLRFAEDHHFKYFPTGLHAAIAAHMPPDRRFADLWVDQGVFITALPPGAVEAMNERLKLTNNSRCIWGWIAPSASDPA